MPFGCTRTAPAAPCLAALIGGHVGTGAHLAAAPLHSSSKAVSIPVATCRRVGVHRSQDDCRESAQVSTQLQVPAGSKRLSLWGRQAVLCAAMATSGAAAAGRPPVLHHSLAAAPKRRPSLCGKSRCMCGRRRWMAGEGPAAVCLLPQRSSASSSVDCARVPGRTVCVTAALRSKLRAGLSRRCPSCCRLCRTWLAGS